MQDVSDELMQVARSLGLSQKELASRIGVSQPTISRLYRQENQKHGPAFRKVVTFLNNAPKGGTEYSGIQDSAAMLAAHFEKLRPNNDQESDAVDKLLTAIENYVEIRSKEKR